MSNLATNRLVEIAVSVNTEYAELESMLQKSMARAVTIGGLLTEAKELAGHGNWGKWIKDNFPFSERTAQNYMRVFANYPELTKSATVADLTYREAVGLLAEPKQGMTELFLSDACDWTDALKWASQEWERILVLPNDIPSQSEMTPAKKILATAQEFINLEERQERIEKYLRVMRKAMTEAKQDDIFPMLPIELQQKVNDWVGETWIQ